ncbi:unnamed protein product, partial [Ectocarpus sp. 8 AP-2014]
QQATNTAEAALSFALLNVTHTTSWQRSDAKRAAAPRESTAEFNLALLAISLQRLRKKESKKETPSTMAQTDREALVALYGATGGADWTSNENWITVDDLSQWHGVEINDDGRVVKLQLFSNNLRS